MKAPKEGTRARPKGDYGIYLEKVAGKNKSLEYQLEKQREEIHNWQSQCFETKQQLKTLKCELSSTKTCAEETAQALSKEVKRLQGSLEQFETSALEEAKRWYPHRPQVQRKSNGERERIEDIISEDEKDSKYGPEALRRAALASATPPATKPVILTPPPSPEPVVPATVEAGSQVVQPGAFQPTWEDEDLPLGIGRRITAALWVVCAVGAGLVTWINV
jgi:hypothetical protein